MHLRRIEIRDFRKLDHVVVEGLQDGLNVLVGDNEAGKSTLLAALRAALFERHRVGGEVAAGMLPYGQSVRPEVAIEFELDGKAWRLRKAFCQRPEAELIGPGERHTGDQVEDRLAELFGFTPPGKGRSKPEEHQGIYGLLWVEQGAAHRSLNIGGGRESIASALETEVGQVLGGERGRALLGAAEARRDSFWDRREKPRGGYKALLDEVAALTGRKAEIETRLAGYDEKIAALEAAQEALARHLREDRLNRAVEAATAARQAVAEAQKVEAALTDAEEKRKRCQNERDAASDRDQARAQLIRTVEDARAAAAKAQADAEEAKGTLARHEVSARLADERLAEARIARRRADDRVGAIEQAIARRQATEFLGKLNDQLAAAEGADGKRREALAAAQSVTIDKDGVAELEALQKDLDRFAVQLEAASVRLTFEPDGRRSVTVDGRAHDPEEPLRLSHDASVRLEGFGGLSVRPGGGVDNPARAVKEARRALDERLHKLGFADPAEARAALQAKLDAQREAEAQRKVVAAIAPKGLEALRQAVESQRALAARPLSEDVVALIDATDAMLGEARRARQVASEAEQASETAASQANAAREAAGREAATLDERAAATRRNHDSRVHDLASARMQAADEHLRALLAEAEGALSKAAGAEAEARAALEQADPEVASLMLRRAEAAEQSIRADIERLTREKRDLEIELKALGRDGLGEQLAEVEGELALKHRLSAAKGLEAAASRLLYDTLAQAQRESKDRWLGPVRERVKPYLKLIQPDGDIVLNEDTLEIEQFVRKGVSEPFHALSVGAREQVAVITRLALADILRASGQPSAVILDDALVNTDEGRLERMHLVLHKAAEALQIIILTCRERDFVQLGAPFRRI